MNRDHILGWHERLASPGPALRSEPPATPDTSREDFEKGDHSSPEAEMLPPGVWESSDGIYKARCRSCAQDYELPCSPEEFSEDGNYCGGSDRCIP